MGNTMRMLSPDVLIWHYFVNNYLFGKQPPPVDLLFWNDDATRMPEKMHSFYLREYYLKNRLCMPDELELAGYPIDLRRIKQPLCMRPELEDLAAIRPFTLEYRRCVMQGVAEDMKLSLAPSHRLPVEPNQAVAVVERSTIHVKFFR